MRVTIPLVASSLVAQEFEVASVKPSTPQERDISPATYPGGRITIGNFTLKQLIEHAYGVERFQISENSTAKRKEASILALVFTSKGPKLEAPKNRDDRPLVMLGFDGDISGPRLYYIAGQNATMPLLAQRLAQMLRKPVRDETRLSGNFDFKFNYDEDETNASLVAAIQQLGLKLESRKGPVEHLIVDHAEKPTPN